MTRYRIALGFLFLCAAAAPFLKSVLVRRGVSGWVAYASGFGLVALGAVVLRLAGG